MREEIKNALANDVLIEFTTYGRKSGKPHRVETRFLFENGNIYVSGFPSKRDWVANLRADSRALVHLKEHTRATLEVQGRVVEDQKERIPLLIKYMEFWTPVHPIEKAARCIILTSIKAWVKLRLPLWGPMWPVARIMKGMPLVEFTIIRER